MGGGDGLQRERREREERAVIQTRRKVVLGRDRAQKPGADS